MTRPAGAGAAAAGGAAFFPVAFACAFGPRLADAGAGAGAAAAARRPGVPGVKGATMSSQARLDGRKGLDATILGAKPKDWLASEVGAAVAQQKLRDQVAFQVEIRPHIRPHI